MKTQISRWSDRPRRRYQGVYLQQGRMVTDADWNEQVEQAKATLRATAADAVGDGVPRAGGCLERTGDTAAQLQWGVAHVDGIRAALVPVDGEWESPEDVPFDIGVQADLHSAAGSTLQGGVGVYLDVWERTVVALEDDRLADPALGGADTASRQQVVAQLKQSPLDEGELVAADPEGNPRIGTGRFAAAVRTAGADPDPCDPCADELNLDQAVPNALFRMEVHDVDDPADPREIVLKWSMENAAEAFATSPPPPPWFESDTHVYEAFATRTEQHMGAFLAPPGGDTSAVPLVDDLADLPDPPPGEAWTGVRRWDGTCMLVRDGGSWRVDDDAAATDRGLDLVAGDDRIEVSGTQVSFPLRQLTITLTLPADGTLRALRGDYWLARVRSHPPVAEGVDRRVQVVSETPVGILHHYLPLGTWDGDQLDLGDDTHRRAMTFPPLTDLRADDVGYTPCEDGPFDPGDTTVQKALDALCDLDASEVDYKGDCGLLRETGTVAEALDTLCEEVEARVQDCWPRLALFGRGVVCGAIPTAERASDQRGRIVDAIADVLRRTPLETVDVERPDASVAPRDVTGARAEMIMSLVEGVRAEEYDRVRETIEDLRTPVHAERYDEVYDLLEAYRTQRLADGITVTFRSSASTVVDGHGCIHRVDDLEMTTRVRSWRTGLGQLDDLPVFRNELARFVEERPLDLSESTLRHDIEERREELVSHVLSTAPSTTDEARSALDTFSWRSGRLRDAVADRFVEIAGTERVARCVTGWLYMVFPDGTAPALEFREKEPDPWVTPPPLLLKAHHLLSTGSSKAVSTASNQVMTTLSAIVAEQPDIPSDVLDTNTLMRTVDAASDDAGNVDIGLLAAELADLNAAMPRTAEMTTLLTDALAGSGQPTVEVTRDDGRRATFVPAAEVAGHGAAATSFGGLVDPSLLEVAGEREPRTPVQRAWRAFEQIQCPPENDDGAVCLGKVAAYGDEIAIVPTDREQLLATPANVNAMMHAPMRTATEHLFQSVMDDISGGQC